MSTNDEMVDYWNGAGGARWVAARDRYDSQLDPLSEPLMEALAPRAGERVLDVGCGAGSFGRQVAGRVGAEGSVTGVDVSRPLLDLAAGLATEEGLAEVVELVEADVQLHPFDGGAFDAVTSRFGVMFFADPVAAFANLARATRPGGRLAMLVWQSRDLNPWAQLPLSIAASFVPEPDLDPDAPGPWSLARPPRAEEVLGAAGWSDIGVAPSTGTLLVGGPAELGSAVDFTVEHGVVTRLLGDATPDVKEAVRDALTRELAAAHDGEGIRLGYACWIVTATRPETR